MTQLVHKAVLTCRLRRFLRRTPWNGFRGKVWSETLRKLILKITKCLPGPSEGQAYGAAAPQTPCLILGGSAPQTRPPCDGPPGPWNRKRSNVAAWGRPEIAGLVIQPGSPGAPGVLGYTRLPGISGHTRVSPGSPGIRGVPTCARVPRAPGNRMTAGVGEP